MKQLIAWAAAVALALTLVTVASAGAQDSTDDPAQVEAGQAVYENNCAGCHGADGAGTERGRPLTDIASQEADRSVHIASVTDGKGGMPAFGESLSAEEIDAAVSYVRLTFVTEDAPDTAPEPEPEPVAAEEPPMEELPNTGSETTVLLIIGLSLVAAGAVVQLSRVRFLGRS